MRSLRYALLLLILLTIVIGIMGAETKEKEYRMNPEEMKQFHRDLGASTFNRSWEILLKEDRKRTDEDYLLNMVHASLFHWRQVGEPVNVLRGEWMIAHVYTLLKHKEAAFYHAENVLRIAEEIKAKGWDLAYSYEAMARVMALHGNKEEFEKYHALALAAGEKIAEEGDRKQFDADMNDEYWFGMK